MPLTEQRCTTNYSPSLEEDIDKLVKERRVESMKYFHYLRDAIIKWEEHNFPDTPAYRNLLGMGEELGELFHAHLKGEQSIRLNEAESRAKKKDAMGDILIYAINYCSKNNICLLECLETAWKEVKQRDWIKFPKNGRTE